jgi:hypothetical protein
MSNTRQPFLGVFRAQDGELMDLYSGQVITPAQVKPNMPPFNGVFLDKDGIRRDLTDLITGGGGGGEADVFSQTFTNATFSGEVNAIAVPLRKDITIVSFWGFALQNATGTPAQEFSLLDPATYPLLERFVGQVDQFAIGYNAATNDFKYIPIRITNEGMYIVTAPNISIGTRFSYQFVLILAETE